MTTTPRLLTCWCLVLGLVAACSDPTTDPAGSDATDVIGTDTAGSETTDAAGDEAEAVADAGDVGDDGEVSTDAEVVEDVPQDLPPPPPLTAVILEPLPTQTFEFGETVVLKGKVGGGGVPPNQITVQWFANGEALGQPTIPGPDGSTTQPVNSLLVGDNIVSLEASLEGFETVVAGASITICDPVLTFDNDVVDAGWKLYGDAHWDPGGWLELTGNYENKQGSIYYVDKLVFPGDIHLSMSLYTGNGIHGGGDGFAMNIWDVPSVEDLDEIVATAGLGGCLGYGVTGVCGPMDVTAFHIEFDTWYSTEGIFDPTQENHIAVTLDGDPQEHVLWAPVPNLEDGQWHDITVQIVGSHIQLTFDGYLIINEVVPGFLFKGGYLGFSGSTGGATNFHRIDNLGIDQGCLQ